MNIWLVMLLGGLITFSMRFSLIYLLAEGRFEIGIYGRRGRKRPARGSNDTCKRGLNRAGIANQRTIARLLRGKPKRYE
jgi:hypothetical protein